MNKKIFNKLGFLILLFAMLLNVGIVNVARAEGAGPQVISVSNQGMRIIKVKFVQAVDKTSAETVANYIPKNNGKTPVNVLSAKLLDDQRTVQLFLDAGFYNDSIQDSIEIKNVENVAQTATMLTVVKLLTIKDISTPSVVSVEILDLNTIGVTFSEPVQINGYGYDDGYGYGNPAFKLNDKSLSFVETPEDSSDIDGVKIIYPYNEDYTKLLITFTNPVSEGYHTLIISSGGTIEDYNTTINGLSSPYIIQPCGYVVNVTAPQVVSVYNKGMRMINVEFDRAIDKTSAETVANYIPKNNGKTPVDVLSARLLDDQRTVQLFLDAGFYNDLYDDSIEIKNVRSASGLYPMGDITKFFIINDNELPIVPSYLSTKSLDRQRIVMNFSEPVQNVLRDSGGDEIISNGEYYTEFKLDGKLLYHGNGISNGTRLYGVTITYPYNGDYTKALIDFGSPILVLQNIYQLSVSCNNAISDYHVNAQGNVDYLQMEAFIDYFVVRSDDTAPTLYPVTNAFSHGINYSASANRIIIRYSKPMGDSAINALNYKIKDFNVIDDNHIDYIKISDWTTLSDISDVSLSFRNNSDYVVIDFPANINIVNGETDFMIGYIDGNYTHSPKGKYNDFFFENTDNGNPTLTGENLMFDDPVYNDGPALKAASLIDPSHLTLVFDRKLKADSQNASNLANDIIITQTVSGQTIAFCGSDITVKFPDDKDSSVVNFTLPISLSILDPVIIRTVMQGDIQSIGADNLKIVANTAGITSSSFVANSIVASLNDGVIKNNSYLTISFNKLLDKSSIISDWSVASNCGSVSDSINVGEESDTCYKSSTKQGVIFNKKTGKVLLNNIGELYNENGFGIYDDSSEDSINYNAFYIYNETKNKLYVQFIIPDNDNRIIRFKNGALTYIPIVGLKTTIGTNIDSNFKPVININAIDKIAPKIILNGSNDVNVNYGESYIDSGINVVDDYDADIITSNIATSGSVDTSKLGTYIITYSAHDTSNNITTATRTVNVVQGDKQIIPTISTDVNNEIKKVDVTVGDDQKDKDIILPPLIDEAYIKINHDKNGNTINIKQYTINDGKEINNIPKIKIEAPSVTVDIPQGTTISTNTTWSSVIKAPEIKDNTTVTTTNTPTFAESGYTRTATAVIDMGANVDLKFSYGVRILIPNQANKMAGYIDSSSAFHEITDTCSADTQTVGDALSEGKDCKINVGNDLVVWTRHFTTFVAFDRYAISVPSSSYSNSYTAYCSNFVYGDWGICENGYQTRSITSWNGGNTCSKDLAITRQSCIPTSVPVVNVPTTPTPIIDNVPPFSEEKIVEPTNKVTPTPSSPASSVKTYANGTLLRAPDKKIYVVTNNKLAYVSTIAELKKKYAGKEILEATSDTINSYSKIIPGVKTYANGTLLRAPNQKIYVIVNGKKQHIKTLDELKKNYKNKTIYNVSDQVINQYASL